MLTENKQQPHKVKDQKLETQPVNQGIRFELQPAYPSQNFIEYYESQTAFIQNLRKQSSRIQSLLKVMDRLKADNQLKERQLQKYRRKQNEYQKQLIVIEDDLRQQYEQIIRNLREKVNNLEEQKQYLTRQNCHFLQEIQKFKNQCKRPLLGAIHKENISQQTIERMENKINKLIAALSNCKQENNILRLQLEDNQKLRAQLESSLLKNRNKIKNILDNNQAKLELMRHQLQTKDREIAAQKKLKQALQLKNSQIEEQIYRKLTSYEIQIKEMIKQVTYMQNQSQEWKQKYLGFVQWAHWVDHLRSTFQYEKMNGDIEKDTIKLQRDLAKKYSQFWKPDDFEFLKNNNYSQYLKMRQYELKDHLRPEHDLQATI